MSEDDLLTMEERHALIAIAMEVDRKSRTALQLYDAGQLAKAD